jgi:hypothetical protein
MRYVVGVSVLASVMTAALDQRVSSGLEKSFLVAQNVDQQKFEKKFQDVRENIAKSTPQSPPSDAGAQQQSIDLCRANSRLPQCTK